MIGDLDNLKFINDSYGHQIGDNYLIKAAQILKKVLRSEDIVSRIGGDEFAIILPNTDKNEAENIKYRIQNQFKKTQRDEVNFKMLDISLGFYTIKNSSTNFKKAYRNADQRMYEQKHNKRKGNLSVE